MNLMGDNILGVIGGMGPLATEIFYRMIVEMTPTTTDQEHLYNHPARALGCAGPPRARPFAHKERFVRIGFDRDKYLRMQSERIAQRRAQFGGTLYLEFGGKLVDDMHASRVLPGFTPDNKIVTLLSLFCCTP